MFSSLQEKPCEAHFLISSLKTVSGFSPLLSLVILFHILAPVLAIELIPKCVEWMLDLEGNYHTLIHKQSSLKVKKFCL